MKQKDRGCKPKKNTFCYKTKYSKRFFLLINGFYIKKSSDIKTITVWIFKSVKGKNHKKWPFKDKAVCLESKYDAKMGSILFLDLYLLTFYPSIGLIIYE